MSTSIMHKRSVFPSMLEKLPSGEPFPMDYKPSRIDRVALDALTKVFPPAAVSAARTQYHRSNLNFDALKEDLLRFDKPRPPRHHQSSYYMAVQSVRDDLGFKNLNLIPWTTGAIAKSGELPNSKSPGLPWKLEGYKTKGDVAKDPNALARIRQIWYDVENGKDVELPDVACYARAQLCAREKERIRATWGYSATVYFGEASYFYPLLNYLKEHKNPIIAYGVEIATGGMSFLNSIVNSYPGSPYLLGDWSSFDKTIPAWLIRDAFKVLHEAFDFSHVQDSEGKIWPVRAYRSNRRWRKIVQYFIDTPIRLSNGERYMKHCGVPSGTCFTNIIDSVVNAIVMRYLIYETTGQLPIADLYLGDDSFIVLPHKVDLNVISELALDEFGMVFNADKSWITSSPSNIHFLGYYNDCGVPTKPIDAIVASAIYPERPVRNALESISRLVGQAYSCFDPDYATQFFKAAHIVATEAKISHQDIEDIIHANPHKFKYLTTIGVNVKAVTFPVPPDDGLLYVTLPTSQRRFFSHRNRDESVLYHDYINDPLLDQDYGYVSDDDSLS